MSATTPEVPAHLVPAAALAPQEAQRIAESGGLVTLGERPPLGTYVRNLWQHRGFLWTLSRAESASKNSSDQLGRLWSVLTPLTLIASYYFIFGVLLQQNRAPDYIPFLAVGVIMFSFTSSVVQQGSKAMVSNVGLIRALHFPRAILPISVAISEFITTLPAVGVLIALMLTNGQPPNMKWLLLPLALVLHALILGGAALIGARIVNISRDLGNLIPMFLRIMRYISGVFFVIGDKMQGVAGHILTYQPFAVTLDLTRDCLMTPTPGGAMHGPGMSGNLWIAAAIWAIVLPTVGLIFFWRDEAKYGRG